MSATHTGAIASVYRPRTAARALPLDIALVLGGAAVTALFAQVSIALPFTPVPITGQTFAVLLTAGALGAVRGIASQAVYLLAGVAGMHVFADGAHGLAVLTGATGGYLVGFVVAAALVGALADRGWDRRPASAWGMMLLGNLAIYAAGLPWLYASVGSGLCSPAGFTPQAVCENPVALTLYAGFFPFVIGDTVKLLLAGGVLPTTWAALGRGRR